MSNLSSDEGPSLDEYFVSCGTHASQAPDHTFLFSAQFSSR